MKKKILVIIDNFIDGVYANKLSLQVIYEPLYLNRKEQSDEATAKLNRYKLKGDAEPDDDGFAKIKIRSEGALIVIEALKKSFRSTMALHQIMRGILVSNVSLFDNLAGNLRRLTLLSREDALRASTTSPTIEDLFTVTSIDALKELLASRETEKNLRESRSQIIEIILKKTRFRLTNDEISLLPEFFELVERRNLMVHANGIVNEQYINGCRDADFDLGEHVVVGKKVGVPKEYLQESFDAILAVGLFLAIAVAARLCKEQINEILLPATYNLIVEGFYIAAIHVIEAPTISKLVDKFSDEDRLSTLINLAQAYKWSGNGEKCREILEELDFSASANKFKLSKAVLLDDFETAGRLMPLVVNEDAVTDVAFATWPVFQDFRKTEIFKTKFRDLFKSTTTMNDYLNELGINLDLSSPVEDEPEVPRR